MSTCSADNDCRGGEAMLGLCNTAAGVCISQRCRQSSDCPSDQPSCVDFTDGGGDTGCACTTDALCLDGYRCNPLDRLCEAPCTQDADCSVFVTPRVCSGGLCLPSADGGP